MVVAVQVQAGQPARVPQACGLALQAQFLRGRGQAVVAPHVEQVGALEVRVLQHAVVEDIARGDGAQPQARGKAVRDIERQRLPARAVPAVRARVHRGARRGNAAPLRGAVVPALLGVAQRGLGLGRGRPAQGQAAAGALAVVHARSRRLLAYETVLRAPLARQADVELARHQGAAQLEAARALAVVAGLGADRCIGRVAGLARDDADHARFGIAAVQGRLRAAQHLHAVHALQVVLEALGHQRGHAIDQQQCGRGERHEVGRQSAHHGRLHARLAEGLEHKARHLGGQRVQPAHAGRLQRRAVEDGDAGGHGVQALGLLVHRDRDLGQGGFGRLALGRHREGDQGQRGRPAKGECHGFLVLSKRESRWRPMLGKMRIAII
ncbi:MAG: hypothetical protein GAK34_02638 [Delftia tsuruhatensis]|nr:MAG: hypothetical protein GAK34_02638 [Delftia tsuruhatensis]